MIGVAYPRRRDEVRYERFDGTLESVQRIASLTQQPVHVAVSIGPRDCVGDTLKECEIAEGSVKAGQFVVRKADDRIAIMGYEGFHDMYSKDGN